MFQCCLYCVSRNNANIFSEDLYFLRPIILSAHLIIPVHALSEFDLRALRTGVMAGSPCPIEVMKRLIADMNLREMTICYGMTETSPVSTQARGSDARAITSTSATK